MLVPVRLAVEAVVLLVEDEVDAVAADAAHLRSARIRKRLAAKFKTRIATTVVARGGQVVTVKACD